MPAALGIVDEKMAELAALTGLSKQEWRDFFACTPDQQKVIVQNYKDADWTKTSDSFNKVLDLLAAISAAFAVVPVLAPFAAGATAAIAAVRLIQSF